jgi:hypothetical protein
MSAPLQNVRASTVQNILGQATTAARKFSTNMSSVASTSFSSALSPENGNYILSVLFYVLFYGFIIFIALIIVHFTFTPIFRFSSGAKGFIGIPAKSSDKVYWTSGHPPPESRVPLESDEIASYEFENTFSFSVDLYCTKITSTDVKNRLVLYKTYKYGVGQEGDFNSGNMNTQNIDSICAARAAEQNTNSTNTSSIQIASPLANPPTASQSLETYMQSKCSMFMYITETNDLIITFFTGQNGTPYSCKPIRNIPLYTPFRISCVVDKKVFTVYLNGKQTFQRILPQPIGFNSKDNLRTASQRFYSAPSWAGQTVFLQNFHIWPRSIRYSEVSEAMPALASVKDFKIPNGADDSSLGQCNS